MVRSPKSKTPKLLLKTGQPAAKGKSAGFTQVTLSSSGGSHGEPAITVENSPQVGQSKGDIRYFQSIPMYTKTASYYWAPTETGSRAAKMSQPPTVAVSPLASKLPKLPKVKVPTHESDSGGAAKTQSSQALVNLSTAPVSSVSSAPTDTVEETKSTTTTKTAAIPSTPSSGTSVNKRRAKADPAKSRKKHVAMQKVPDPSEPGRCCSGMMTLKLICASCLLVLLVLMAAVLYFTYRDSKHQQLSNVSIETYRSTDTPSPVCSSDACLGMSRSLLDSMDFSVDPCTDFRQFVCGKWPEKHPIPEGSQMMDQHTELDAIFRKEMRQALDSQVVNETLDDRKVRKAIKMYYKCVHNDSETATNKPDVWEQCLAKTMLRFPVQCAQMYVQHFYSGNVSAIQSVVRNMLHDIRTALAKMLDESDAGEESRQVALGEWDSLRFTIALPDGNESSFAPNSTIIPLKLLHPPLFHLTYPASINFGGLGFWLVRHIFSLSDSKTAASLLAAASGKCKLQQELRYNKTQFSETMSSPPNQYQDELHWILLAFEAFRESRSPHLSLPQLPSFTSEQLYFISFAFTTCFSSPEGFSGGEDFEYKPHANFSLTNLKPFAEAFHCSSETEMNQTNCLT